MCGSFVQRRPIRNGGAPRPIRNGGAPRPIRNGGLVTFSGAPFAKPHLRCSPSLRDYLCSLAGRSLREDVWLKTRASTIFSQISSLAELGG